MVRSFRAFLWKACRCRAAAPHAADKSARIPQMNGADEFVFVALGGLGEIGMNAALYGFGPPRRRKWIMVDCGMTFAGPDLPGVELIYPDVSFIDKIQSDLLA